MLPSGRMAARDMQVTRVTLVTLLAVVTVMMAAGAASAKGNLSPLVHARSLYNQRQFEAAVSAAEEARLIPGRADSADLIAARAYLERYRETQAADDLANARDRLRRLDAQR